MILITPPPLTVDASLLPSHIIPPPPQHCQRLLPQLPLPLQCRRQMAANDALEPAGESFVHFLFYLSN
jgi:hypothetical protein